MQHLMNYVTSAATRNWQTMDIWIDEGLSSAAEYIYREDHTNDRYDWFKSDPQGTIARGHNFFVWGNYPDNSILDDYATVYLFFQWVRIQTGRNPKIYKEIIGSEHEDYRAVTKAVKSSLDTVMADDSDWNGLLKTWLAANYINASSGPYGYKDEDMLRNLEAKTARAGTTSLPLLPGEGVYSIVNNGTGISQAGSGSNIKYAYLYGNGASNTPGPGGALLTYNANTDNTDGAPETGNLTGVAASVVQAQGRSAVNTAWEGPVRIDARDMLARNGKSAVYAGRTGGE
jgi:hypothetical protein